MDAETILRRARERSETREFMKSMDMRAHHRKAAARAQAHWSRASCPACNSRLKFHSGAGWNTTIVVCPSCSWNRELPYQMDPSDAGKQPTVFMDLKGNIRGIR